MGVGIALPLAASMGFDPQGTAPGDDTFGIRFVSTMLPTLLAFPAALLLFRYPIDEERHAAIRAELALRGIIAPGAARG